jgi:hypothetical protein
MALRGVGLSPWIARIPAERTVGLLDHDKQFINFESEPKGRDQGRQHARIFKHTMLAQTCERRLIRHVSNRY